MGLVAVTGVAGASTPATVKAPAAIPSSLRPSVAKAVQVSAAKTPIGQTPKVPARSKALGAAPATQAISVDVALQPSDPAALSKYATDVSTPGSAVFHQYLTPAQFATRFGASTDGIAQVEAALRSVGLTPGAVSANRLSIAVTASAGALGKAFSTRFTRYRTPDGRSTFTNTSAPSIPVSAAPYVMGIIGLDNLNIRHSQQTKATHPTTSPGSAKPNTVHPAAAGPTPCTGALNAQGSDFTYDQLASLYGLTGLYGAGNLGAGQTVAIYELEPYLASDVATFQTCYGTNVPITKVNVDGGPGSGTGVGEAALDIETVLALAPAAKIRVYQGPNNTDQNAYDVYNSIVSQDVASVISTSWGECEPDALSGGSGDVQAENALFEEAAAQGQSILAASGDSGSEACFQTNQQDTTLNVQDPASQPFVTSVGGTTIDSVSSGLPSESVWNNGDGAAGGGLSSFWTNAPSYQRTDAGATSAREVPDVSADADPETGYEIFWDNSWVQIGGTSAAAPLWAAVLALTNAGCTQRVGFANPALYYTFSPNDTVVVGNDVQYSSGFPNNNDYTGTNNGEYPVGIRYDMATGLGSPRAAALAGQLCKYPITQPSRIAADFNGDGHADVAIWRPSNGIWYEKGISTYQWGQLGDIPVAGDYNGNNTIDLAVYRPSNGNWYERGIRTVQYGQPGDIPVPGDYNGDKKTDVAVYRPSTGVWYLNGIGTVAFGQAGDVPVPGDYNGDGKTDIAVYRPSTSTWYIRGVGTYAYGSPGDVPIVGGDFNGDRKTDIAVWRPSNGNWYERGLATVQWGQAGDVPMVGDFNGDKTTDIVVYRPSSSSFYERGVGTFQYGQKGDVPV